MIGPRRVGSATTATCFPTARLRSAASQQRGCCPITDVLVSGVISRRSPALSPRLRVGGFDNGLDRKLWSTPTAAPAACGSSVLREDLAAGLTLEGLDSTLIAVINRADTA